MLLASVSIPHKNPLKQHPAVLQIASYGRVGASRLGVIHQLAEVLCFTWNMGRQEKVFKYCSWPPFLCLSV